MLGLNIFGIMTNSEKNESKEHANKLIAEFYKPNVYYNGRLSDKMFTSKRNAYDKLLKENVTANGLISKLGEYLPKHVIDSIIAIKRDYYLSVIKEIGNI